MGDKVEPGQRKDCEEIKEIKDRPKDKNSEIDEELDDLLDSALKDFSKPPAQPPPPKINDVPSEGATSGLGNSSTGKPQDPSTKPEVLSDMFAEEFSEEMAKQFEDAMKNFMSDDPGLMQQIEKLAEVAGNTGNTTGAQQEFTDTLTQTLSSLVENSEHLQDQMSEDDLLKAFTSMGMEDSQEGFMPMMQGMMSTLLSKDVLYPSLKELTQKYPKWLEENESQTEPAQLDKYRKQHILIDEICEEFESESSLDTDEQKKLRFEKILDLMQQMQDLGQPPKEIAPGLEFDENGMPKMPGSPEGCSVM
ncbi:hypothetical protein KUTeg_006267 [Tegillarca granosa]|uniref:Peroxin-19 n=1 Tax=Tegillarca granosa TaxID=220873 RepID=A0ABQ9FFZ6_TEGGR|nr:hypothetical protein KUTeg_006267 [Tegillarca granosa]